MFKNNEITICVGIRNNLDVQAFLDKHVQAKGLRGVYARGNDVYIGFRTKMTIKEVATSLEETLCKSETFIFNNVIFVTFKGEA